MSIWALVFLLDFTLANEPQVETITAQIQKVQKIVKYPALIKPTVSGKLTSEITGIVTRIIRPLGTKVRQGDIVFYLKNNQSAMTYNEYGVRAPVSGVVAKLDVFIGKLIGAGESAGEVVNPNLFKFVAQVPASDGKILKVGYLAIFEFENESIKAQISALSPVVNPQTGTLEMELVPTQKVEKPLLGAVGRLSVYLPPQDYFLLPPEALIKINYKKFVRKVDEQNKIHLMEIQTGDLINGQQVITHGLNEKDEIVIRASQFLKEGDKVKRQAKSNTPSTSTMTQ